MNIITIDYGIRSIVEKDFNYIALVEIFSQVELATYFLPFIF